MCLFECVSMHTCMQAQETDILREKEGEREGGRKERGERERNGDGPVFSKMGGKWWPA